MRRYSIHTVQAYVSDLRQFADFVEHTYSELACIERVHVSAFSARVIDQGLSPRSLHRKLSALSGYFNYLRAQGHNLGNPVLAVAKPNVTKALPTVARTETTEKLFNPSQFETAEHPERDKAILALFYGAGLRRSEVIDLTFASLREDEGYIKVLGKGMKERLVPVPAEVFELVGHYIATMEHTALSDEPLFTTQKGKKLSPSFVYRLVKNYLSTVSTMDKRSPHVLRHSYATHLMNNGASIQVIKELLGHSSLAATQVYTHTSLERLKEVYSNAHPNNLLSNPKNK